MPTGFNKDKRKGTSKKNIEDPSVQASYEDKILEEAKSSGTGLNDDGQLEAGLLNNQVDNLPEKDSTSSSVHQSNLLNELIKGLLFFRLSLSIYISEFVTFTDLRDKMATTFFSNVKADTQNAHQFSSTEI